MFSTSGGYHEYIGGYHEYIGGYHEYILSIKSVQKIYKILSHKIHEAPTEFFSETLRK